MGCPWAIELPVSLLEPLGKKPEQPVSAGDLRKARSLHTIHPCTQRCAFPIGTTFWQTVRFVLARSSNSVYLLPRLLHIHVLMLHRSYPSVWLLTCNCSAVVLRRPHVKQLSKNNRSSPTTMRKAADVGTPRPLCSTAMTHHRKERRDCFSLRKARRRVNVGKLPFATLSSIAGVLTLQKETIPCI